MDKQPIEQSGVVARLPLRPGGADAAGLEALALALMDGHAFSLGADGTLGFAAPARVARMLCIPASALQTGRAAWEARMEATAVRRRRRALRSLSWSGARVRLDYTLRTEQGTHRHVRETVEARGPAAGPLSLHGVIADRTDAHAREARLVWAARHDAATALPNSETLCEHAAIAVRVGARLGVATTLLRLRLANLGELGATYGPDCADRLIALAADRLRDTVRHNETLARVGEADLAVVVTDGVDALETRLVEALSGTPYATPFGPLYLDVRAARAALTPLPGAAAGALEAARAELCGEAQPARMAARLDPGRDVIDALETDRISLAFQPIVHARGGAVHHHECLLRLREPSGRMVSAGEIVQHAERLGLVSQLDERALALAVPHLRKHADLHLALNVSAGTLGEPRAAARYLSALAELGPLAARLTIEMTETLAVDDPAAAARFSSEVRRLGCRFAVDDFGSGYTTFRNLMAVEADSLKIDGSLIRGIATDDSKQTFIRMMVDLAQTFSVETVAEMVETEADAAVLRRLGVDYLQGYLFGYPGPAAVWSAIGQS